MLKDHYEPVKLTWPSYSELYYLRSIRLVQKMPVRSEAPDVVRIFRPEPDAGPVIEQKTRPLRLLLRYSQPLTRHMR